LPRVEVLEDRTLPAPLLALTGDGHLLTFDSTTPAAIVRNVVITGLNAGDHLQAMAVDDHGTVYGVAGTTPIETAFDRIYTLNPVTGRATAGASLQGTHLFSEFGTLAVSFDPATGKLRAIDDVGDNEEIDPATGAVTDQGRGLVFQRGDINENAGVQLAAIAYTNPAAIGGSTSLRLFGMSTQGTPALVLIGGAQSVDSGATYTVAAAPVMSAFTIAGATNAAFAVSRNPGSHSTISTLWAVNMKSGAQSQLGKVTSSTPIIALAPLPAAAAPQGTITGGVFVDANDDGVREGGESGVAGVTVFVDFNRNGRLDPSEVPYSVVTDGQGRYRITHVPAGTYPVLEVGGGTTLAAPSSNDRDFGFAVAANYGLALVGDPLALRSDPADHGNPNPLGRAYLYSAQFGMYLDELPAPAPTNTDGLFSNRDAFGFSVALGELGGMIGVGSPFRWTTVPAQDGSTHRIHGAAFVYHHGLDAPDEVGLGDATYLSGTFLDDGELGLSVTPTGGEFTFTGGVTRLDPSNGQVHSSAILVMPAGGTTSTIVDEVPGLFESFAPGHFYDPTTGHDVSCDLAGDPGDDVVDVDPVTLGRLLHDPNGGGSSFGTSVIQWDHYALVGAPATGAVYQFDLSGLSATSPPPKLVATIADPGNSASDHFGFAMALVGTHELLVGAPGDSTFGASAGAAYLFDLATGELLQTYYGPQPQAGAEYGFAVASNGRSILMGAPSTRNDSDPGAAFLLPVAPLVTVGVQPATADFVHPGIPIGNTIKAVEGRPSGNQLLATVQAFLDYSHPVSIDWGDGGASMGQLVLPDLAHFQVFGSHTYAEGGTYPITITLRSTSDLPHLIVHGTAVVQEAPLGLTFPVHAPALIEGQPVGSVLVANIIDSDAGQQSSHYRATVSWGDGETSTTAAGNVTIVSAGTARGDRFFVYATKPDPYAEEGPTLVTVTVADIGGTSVTRQERLTVADAALTLTLAAPSLMEGQPIDPPIVVATFTDADAGATAADYTASVSWGDGQVSTTAAGNVSIMAQGGAFQVLARKANPYHRAGSNIPFSVLVRDRGVFDRRSGQVTVADAPLTLTVAPPAAVEGQSLSLVLVGTFTDANPGAVASDSTATVDWGDGQTSTSAAGLVAIQPDPHQPGLFVIRARKPQPYAEESSGVPFRVTVTDRGGASDGQSWLLPVADAPLTLTGMSFTVSAGTSFTNVVASFRDLDRQGTVADYTASIDWGDSAAGDPPDVTFGTVRRLRNGTFTVAAQGNHAYAAAGTYNVTVTVQDTGGPFSVVSTAHVG
jgi:hypothetical protein